MTATSVIRRWIEALSTGNEAVAEAFLSGRFTKHDGMTREQYLRHELTEFRERKDGFDVPDAPDVIEEATADGLSHIIVLSASGGLAYEDWLRLDESGLIVGNDRMFEVVSKLQFSTATERPHRALAIRSHGADILHAFPLFSTAFSDFVPCDTYESDRFNLLTFDDEEDLVSIERRFRAVTERERATFSALLRGTDHPYFIGERYPQISGCHVDIDVERGPIWSVTARFENGRNQTIDCPKASRIAFPADVVSVTMTDAVDNDWTAFAWSSR
jgi:hypothetical protein